MLADGSTEKIGKIVNQRMPVEVLSYDAATDSIVPRKIVDWYDNGPTDQFLQFTVREVRRQRPGAVRCHAEPPDPHAGRLA